MSEPPAPDSCDVIVVGAGPAGATAAALLAQAGFSVVAIERERFPRFHIGESLLPSCLPVLARMGVDLGAEGYVLKRGAEFYDEALGIYSYFPFEDALPGPPRHAYQVERARFDADLALAARSAGATIIEGMTAFAYRVDAHGALVDVAPTPDGSGPDEGRGETTTPRAAVDRGLGRTIHARYLVDASGRRGLLSRSGRDVVAIEGLGRAASFAHWDGIESEVWAELVQRGDVKVIRIDDGWLWVIPLAGRRLSIGVVVRSAPIDRDLVLTEVAKSSLLSRLTAGATVSATRCIADYSYASETSHASRCVAIGDASGFLDPIFSSGVAIALGAAEQMADALVPALRAGTEAAPTLMDAHRERMYHAYRTFHTIAHRFYNSRMFDNLFFGEVPDAQMRSGLISLLGGDVWRDDNVFQRAVLAVGRSTIATAPWSMS